ncbi:MAG: VOC family protein [Pseudomonadota bacterium]
MIDRNARSGQAPGRSTASAFIMSADPSGVIAFATDVLQATQPRAPILRQDGSIWNAELLIGDSTVFVSGVKDRSDARPAFTYVYVDDVDTAFARARERGAESFMPVADQFYGDRGGGIIDGEGNIWWLATHRETLSDDEVQARARAEERMRDAG